MLPVPQALQRLLEQTNLSAKYHPTSGYHYILPDQPPPQNMFQEMKSHPLQQARETNVWYPFDGLGEWSLAKFLIENLSQMQINKFLKLDWRPQFKSKDELFFYMEQLPGRGPQWQCTKLRLKGYESEQPIHLIWRDGLEVMKQLFSNPNQLPEGVTIILIIAASDKTLVTRHTGGLEMHPLFLTIGNIQADICMKAISHVWRCTAFMPIPTFIVNSDFQSLLWACLWHKCMDLICSNLKIAAHVGEYMVDPSARQCYCFTPLISHIANLPKQLMIACIMKNSSPVTMATHKEFGDETPHPPQNGTETYTLIQQLCNHVDPWDLIVFIREAKKLHLSRVHLLYWRNWRHSNLARFLMPEILHTLHKFFLIIHHKHTGVCYFSGGISHVSQMTGLEHQDIQHMIVPMLWGMAGPGFICAVWAMINFIYLAQNPLHMESSIALMTQALQDFHDNKQAILDADAWQGKSGTKDDFFIPKLELMQSFTPIFHVGSLMQWTADVSECLLITHCKHPFECTSCHRDFVVQITRILDQEETIQLFDLYTLLSSSLSMPGQDPLINAIMMEDEEITSTETDPTFTWVSNANPAAQLCLQVPHPVHNHFLKGIMSYNAQIVFNVTLKADRSHLDISQLQSLYNIPDYSHALHLYASCNGCIVPSQLLFNTWWKFRIQLYSTFHTCRIMLSQQIHADLPSPSIPRGNCNTVLFNWRVDGGNDGASVPECLSQVLVYIQHFDFIVPGPKPSMERVIRRGSIIPLADITHAVEIIPVYQGPLGKDVNSGNSLEVFEDYFLNNFAEKELYHSLSVISDN
ncbi:hypothetical protein BDR04DRAFT_1204687 [Suillus decipiens]|nr:hypothetical protein BDR04DRAFT_1204687 [Suillus decipiens]